MGLQMMIPQSKLKLHETVQNPSHIANKKEEGIFEFHENRGLKRLKNKRKRREEKMGVPGTGRERAKMVGRRRKKRREKEK